MFRIKASFQYCGDNEELHHDIVMLARHCGASTDAIQYELDWVADFRSMPPAPINGSGANSVMLDVTITW
jgi:hypothetical protein